MRFLNRILCISIILCLLGCSNNDDEKVNNYEYIEPCTGSLFSLLNSSLKNELYEANTGEAIEDEILEVIGNELIDIEFDDINGITYNLKDFNGKLLIENFQKSCNHCKKQISDYNDSIIENHNELTYIYFFPINTTEDIKEMYSDLSKDFRDDIIYVSKNDVLYDYLKTLNLNMTPSMYCFLDSTLTFVHNGYCTPSVFDRFYDYAFINPINKKDLVDDNNESVFCEKRTTDDVLADLSIDSTNKLDKIDNDYYSTPMTLEIMSHSVDFSDLFISDKYTEIYNYEPYEDKDLVLFYIDYYKDADNDEDINLLNKIIKEHSELSFIGVIIEDDYSTIDGYENGKHKINCPVVSVSGNIPKSFSIINAENYPVAIFIEKGVMTGAYSNILNTRKFNEALEIFIGESSIAHKDNN